MADLATLTSTLTDTLDKIQTWYDEKVGKIEKEQEEQEAAVDEDYPGDEYEDVRAEKKESISEKYTKKKDKAMEKMNEKIAVATEAINAKIEEFNTKKIEDEIAAAQAIVEQEVEAIKTKALFALKL